MLGLGLGVSYRGSSGIRPALDLNFLSGAMDGRLTFARASAGLAYNSSGVLTSYATDIPRFDYDPSTLALKGWLREEERTNLALRSQEFDNASWTKTRTTVSADAVTSPGGTLTADKVSEATDVATNRSVSQNISITSGTTYTLSVYAKAAERAALNLRFASGFAAGNVTFTLSSSGSLANSGTVAASSIQLINGGWYRCSASFTATSTTTAGAQIFLSSGGITYDGVSGSGLYLWGAQAEAGAFATSYIPTTTVSVTRAIDLYSTATTAFSFSDTEGTLYAAFTPLGVTGLQTALYLDDGTSNERMGIRASSGALAAVVVDGGVSQASVSGGTLTAVATKAAMAYRLDDIAFCVNGVAGTTDTSATLPTVTTLLVGTRLSGSESLSGWYTRVAYYNRRLSDAALVRITS